MRNYKFAILSAFALLFVLVSCQDEDQEFGDVIIPSNLSLSFEIVGQDADNPNGDGSGFVNFTGSADNAITYRYDFGDNTNVEVAPSGDATHRFTFTGTNTYTVTLIASGTGGVASSTSVTLDVFSAFDDQEAKDLLTGGVNSSKVWYLNASEPGHLGVGGTIEIAADAYWFPSFFSAAPFEKCNDPISDCLCDDELTFTQDANNELTYELNNNGQTFFNAGHQGVIGEDAGEDACFDFDTSGISNVSLAPSSTNLPEGESRNTIMNFTNDAFMGYYVSSSSYEILSITDNTLYVRTVDGLNPVLAWYHKFSTNPLGGDACEGGSTGDAGSGNNDVMVWSDEFETDGEPCDGNWTFDFGELGVNDEEQVYTNLPENVIVEDGLLKITALADGEGGYTSARLKSSNLFELTYGRIDVRAKLPASQGTWPAIWMLGANIDEVGWPACGEIDIMEQTGQDKNTILGTTHWLDEGSGNPASFGQTTTVADATTEFHVYSCEWNANQIQMLVDDVVYYTIALNSSLPFDSDFFLLLNVAMGGNLGGDIDPAFTEDTMEIDYVRVYQ